MVRGAVAAEGCCDPEGKRCRPTRRRTASRMCVGREPNGADSVHEKIPKTRRTSRDAQADKRARAHMTSLPAIRQESRRDEESASKFAYPRRGIQVRLSPIPSCTPRLPSPSRVRHTPSTAWCTCPHARMAICASRPATLPFHTSPPEHYHTCGELELSQCSEYSCMNQC